MSRTWMWAMSIHASDIELPLASMEMLTDPDTSWRRSSSRPRRPRRSRKSEPETVEAEADPEVIGEKPEGRENEGAESEES